MTLSGAFTTLRLLLGLAATLIVLLLSTAAAQAAITYPYTGTEFGPKGIGAGSFGKVGSIAVQQSTGDVFVYDEGEGKLYKFNAAGEPSDFAVRASSVINGIGQASGNSREGQVAIDGSGGPTAGDIYIANTKNVQIYSEAGVRLGELNTGSEPCGVAVGSSGEVYVGDYKEQTITRYTPSANPVTSADESGVMGGVSSICKLAVDSSGDVYAAKASFIGRVTKYEASQFGSSKASGKVVDSQGKGTALDPASGEILISALNNIAEYDGTTEPPTKIGTAGETGDGELKANAGIALNSTSGKLYTSSYNSAKDIVVRVFGPRAVVPDLTIAAATGVTDSEAVVSGTVAPSGTEVTDCVFEYGTESGNLTETSPCEPNAPYSGTGTEAVSAHLTGLALGKTYYYRIGVSGSYGSISGKADKFKTAAPGIAEESAESITAEGAELHGVVKPSELDITTCSFDYGTERNELTGSVPCEPAPPYTGSGEQAVTARVSGLSLGTKYFYALSAGNQHGAVSGKIESFQTLGPTISGSYFTSVSATTATVGAEVVPNGELTMYTIEFGTTTEYGSATPETSVGGGEGQISVHQVLGELQPRATYHARVVATNASGTFVGPDMVFTTAALSTPGLPNGRSYELVTQPAAAVELYVPYDAGWFAAEEDVVPTSYPVAAAANGDAVSYVGTPTASGNGSMGEGNGNQFRAMRAAGGAWDPSDIQPTGYAKPFFVGFSKNLRFAAVESTEPIDGEGPPKFYPGLYVMNEAGQTSALFSTRPPNRDTVEVKKSEVSANAFSVRFATGNPSYTHLLFSANDALTPEATDPGAAGYNLYEYVEGHLRLVNVLPNGTPAPNAAFGVEAQVSGPAYVREPAYSHVISNDGSRIFWTDLNTGALYVREDGVRTKLIAEGATYLDASADGTKVIYIKSGDLYETDLQTETTSDLEAGAEMVGILGASEDLSYIYFVARGELAEGVEAGEDNLYVLHGGETRYIANVGAEEAGFSGESSVELPWQPDLGERTAKVTPSGRDVVFASKRSLTGYDNSEFKLKGAGAPAEELYEYHAESRSLSCVSCNPSGEQPTGRSFIPLSEAPNRQMNVISEEGTVFFDSSDPLLPQGSNGRVNVYEWERHGAEGCAAQSGCLHLLSTGNSTRSSYLIDASVSGKDVFMMTRSQLSEADENDNYDVYDVRVGAPPTLAHVQCGGTGCQGEPAAPPVFATPPSVTFSGPGNLTPAPPKSHKGKKSGKHNGNGSAARKRRRKLRHALKRCVRQHRHNRQALRACKRRARHRYGAKAARRHRHGGGRRGARKHGHAARNRHHNGRGK